MGHLMLLILMGDIGLLLILMVHIGLLLKSLVDIGLLMIFVVEIGLLTLMSLIENIVMLSLVCLMKEIGLSCTLHA